MVAFSSVSQPRGSAMSHRLRLIACSLVACAALAVPLRAAEVHEFDQNAFNQAQQRGQRILLIIASRWRPSSQDEDRAVENLSRDFRYGDAIFFRVDFDRRKDVTRQLRVNIDGTMIVYRGAQERGRTSGMADEMVLRELLDSAR